MPGTLRPGRLSGWATAGTDRPPARRVWRALGFAGEPWLAVLVAFTALLDATGSILRYVHLQSGVDLAIFDQAVWRYSRFQAPFSSVKGEDVLGDHFHPLVAILAPLFWIWSDPRTLVIAQALLVAASVIPVFLFARDKVDRGVAYLIAGAYATFWGLQVGVVFDFHEVAFAPLLIACAILFTDRRQWRALWVTIGLLLLVKEDLSTFVVFLGVYLMTLREFRRGALTIAAGIAWYELVTRVFIPHFSATGAYSYWTYGQLGSGPLSALWTVIHSPWRIFTVGLSPGEKVHTLLDLFVPFLFLGLSSRVMLLAIPLLAERFLSTNPNYWASQYHYSMTIAPVLAMSTAGGLANLNRWLGRRILPDRWRGRALLLPAAAMLLISVTYTRAGSPDNALTLLTSHSGYEMPAGAAAGAQVLGSVPSDASVATSIQLLAHVSSRAVADPFDYASVRQARFLVVDLLDVGCCQSSATNSAVGQIVDPVLPSLTPVRYDDGWLVARRPDPGQTAASGVLTPMPATTARRVGVALFSWRAALLASLAKVRACNVQLSQGPAGRACFTAMLARLRPHEAPLTRAIAGALPALTGGCAQLGRSALSGVGGVDAAIRTIGTAGRTSSVADVTRAYLAFRLDEGTADRLGILARFAILCTPRAATGPS